MTCPFCHRTIEPAELMLRSPHRDGQCVPPVADDCAFAVLRTPIEEMEEKLWETN
jgi:hypothetical protein